MNVNDFIINIREYFNFPKDDTKLEDIYKREFGFYSPDKLQKVWHAVRRHHKSNFAPSLGNILDYMDKSDVKEQRAGKSQRQYYRCTEQKGDDICGTKYSMDSKLCPKCNENSTKDNFTMNSVELVYCDEYPRDLIELKEICAICPYYQQKRLIRGSKCVAWGTHDSFKKIGLKCDDCPCFKCCNAKPSKAI